MGNIFKLNGTFKPRYVAGVKNSRFIEPHGNESVDEHRIKYENALDLANDIGDVPEGYRAFVILSGRFIFGDFIEALIVKNNWLVNDLTISTLSMSVDNVDSLANLTNGGYVESLNLIVSDYFFSHERHDLMPYLYKTLDVEDRLQLSVASVHTKICMIRTQCGKKITIHGSANLRTSDNIEQIVIENNKGLYEFCYDVHSEIAERHKTINKPVRSKELWQTVLMAGKGNQKAGLEKQPKQKNEHQSASHRAGI
jgi:hypothetical protein